MSRGHGQIQRALLTALDGNDASTVELAHRVYGVPQTNCFSLLKRAQLSAVHRSLAKLATNGLVVPLGNKGHGHDHYWQKTLKGVLAARRASAAGRSRRR
jgi:hypothetical protein